jgi:hypothetical protein
MGLAYNLLRNKKQFMLLTLWYTNQMTGKWSNRTEKYYLRLLLLLYVKSSKLCVVRLKALVNTVRNFAFCYFLNFVRCTIVSTYVSELLNSILYVIYMPFLPFDLCFHILVNDYIYMFIYIS